MTLFNGNRKYEENYQQIIHEVQNLTQEQYDVFESMEQKLWEYNQGKRDEPQWDNEIYMKFRIWQLYGKKESRE